MNFPFEARIALISFLTCYFNFQFYHNTFCLLTNKYLRYWLHDEYSWRVNTREPELRTGAATWRRRAAASSSSSCAAWRALSCGQTWASTVNTRIGNNSCHKTMSCRPAHPLCGHQRARSVLGHDCHIWNMFFFIDEAHSKSLFHQNKTVLHELNYVRFVPIASMVLVPTTLIPHMRNSSFEAFSCFSCPLSHRPGPGSEVDVFKISFLNKGFTHWQLEHWKIIDM